MSVSADVSSLSWVWRVTHYSESLITPDTAHWYSFQPLAFYSGLRQCSSGVRIFETWWHFTDTIILQSPVLSHFTLSGASDGKYQQQSEHGPRSSLSLSVPTGHFTENLIWKLLFQQYVRLSCKHALNWAEATSTLFIKQMIPGWSLLKIVQTGKNKAECFYMERIIKPICHRLDSH